MLPFLYISYDNVNLCDGQRCMHTTILRYTYTTKEQHDLLIGKLYLLNFELPSKEDFEECDKEIMVLGHWTVDEINNAFSENAPVPDVEVQDLYITSSKHLTIVK